MIKQRRDLSRKVREEAVRFHKDFLATIHPAITGVRPSLSAALLVVYPSVSVLKELLCTYSYAHQSEESKSREEKLFADKKARTHAIAAAVGFGLTLASMGLEDYVRLPTHETIYVFEQPRLRAEIVHHTRREMSWQRAHMPLLHLRPRKETYSTTTSAQMGDWYCQGTIDDHITSVEPEHFSSVRLKNRKILSGRLHTFGLEACMNAFKDYKK